MGSDIVQVRLGLRQTRVVGVVAGTIGALVVEVTSARS